MMRIFTLLLFSLLAFGLSAQEERSCSSMELLAEQLQLDPSMLDRMEALERYTEEYERSGAQPRAVITIPIVFHIVHNGQAVGSGENVSDAFVLAQLAQLNDDFRKLNSDAGSVPSIFQGVHADTEIQFCLAQRTPSGAATTGINRINGGRTSWTRSQIESSLKPGTIWDRNQYVNVWSVRFGSGDANLLGYAQFPGGNASTDGNVVAFSTVGSVANPNPAGGSFARGRTLTHEIGHWLNLRHIWGDATCGNDFVSDTPVHNTSNGGCPTYPHLSTCSGSPVEMTMNYMDYTNDVCMYMFTAGQKSRMQAALSGSRSTLASSQGCTPPGGGGGGGGGCSENSVAISITLDNYPGETTWQITNASNTVVASGGPYSTAGATVTASACLPDGCYTFTINDSYGDGICCSYGNGSYNVTVNGTSVASGGSFTTSESSSFCEPNCGTPSGLSATNVTTTSASLNFNTVSGAASYNVRARPIGGTWATGTVSGSPVSYTGLSASTDYEFQVQAVCGTSTGVYSASATFTTPSGGGGGCSETFEPNNSRSTSLPLTAVDQDLSSQISTSTDRDWYRFANTSTNRKIRIDLTNLPADYDLQLFEGSRRRRTSSNGGTTPEFITYNTNNVRSDWYAYVYGYNGAFSNTQCYTLRISLSSTNFREDGSTDGIVEEFEIPVKVIETGFHMFPNPVTDQLQIDLDMEADNDVKVTIGDITGRTHLQQQAMITKGESRLTLDVSRLPAGTYFVRVENGDKLGVQKLVIIR